MLVKDYACRSNLNGVCNIDFNILSNAQDDIGNLVYYKLQIILLLLNLIRLHMVSLLIFW